MKKADVLNEQTIAQPEKPRRAMNHLTEDEMINIILEFKSSGLTPREYCKVNNYPMSNFYYWRKKYFAKYPGEAAKPAKEKKTKKKSTAKKASTAKPAIKLVETETPEPQVELVAVPKKKRGRPVGSTKAKKAEAEVAVVVEAAVVEPIEPTIEEPEKIGTSSIVIRYPNGTKISVDANMDFEKLKQLIQL